MGIVLQSKDYVAYLKKAAEKIAASRDYISDLDAVTGDGDHWANINMGFENVLAAFDDLEKLPIDALLKKVGMILMSKVGGSSGILYGGAYIAASKALAGKVDMGWEDICLSLEAMVNYMMERGKAKPGYKTMIDSLYPAAAAFRQCLSEGKSEADTVTTVRKAAVDGAEATRNMEAVKGRASYQVNKGVGHLDPGAVTMSYQLECLCDLLSEKLR